MGLGKCISGFEYGLFLGIHVRFPGCNLSNFEWNSLHQKFGSIEFTPPQPGCNRHYQEYETFLRLGNPNQDAFIWQWQSWLGIQLLVRCLQMVWPTAKSIRFRFHSTWYRFRGSRNLGDTEGHEGDIYGDLLIYWLIFLLVATIFYSHTSIFFLKLVWKSTG